METIDRFVPYFPKTVEERTHRFIAMPVEGHCLEPRIMDGDTIVVDLDATPTIGNVVLARQDYKLLVKILEDRSGQLWLVALQEEHSRKVTGNTEILGIVVGCARWF